MHSFNVAVILQDVRCSATPTLTLPGRAFVQRLFAKGIQLFEMHDYMYVYVVHSGCEFLDPVRILRMRTPSRERTTT
jgi:hypothetical protein